jgi:predicted ABC-type transport system involved in lysophospholipase L1 biosynthesis, permease component
MIRFALRSLKSHARQFFLTTLAVILGVAFLTGTLSLRIVLSNIFDAQNSTTLTGDLYISGQSTANSQNTNSSSAVTKIDGKFAETVEAIDGVEHAFPIASIPATLVGADSTPVTSMNAPSKAVPLYPQDSRAKVASGRFPHSGGEIALESEALKRSGLSVNDDTHLVINGDAYLVRIVGEFNYDTSVAGATVIGLEPSWLMSFSASDGKVDSISVYLDKGIDQKEISNKIRKILPEEIRVQTQKEAADEQNAEINKYLGYTEVFLLIFVALAMFVGSFIIMNTFAMSVRQRQREFALLRAVGASPGSIFAAVLLHAVMVGTVGALLGLALGIGATRLLLAGLKFMGMPLLNQAPITYSIILAAITAGLVITVIGALFPAREAALTPPIEAMQSSSRERTRSLRFRGILGALLSSVGLVGIIVTWVASGFPRSGVILGIGAGALLIGLLLLFPVLARYGIESFSMPLLLFRPIGRLAIRNLSTVPRRTAATSAALFIGMTLVSAGTIVAASMKASINEIVNDSMHADFLVCQVASSGRPDRVPAKSTEQIQSLDGVASTTGYVAHLVSVEIPNGNSDAGYAIAIDPEDFTKAYDPNLVEGALDKLDGTHVAAFKGSGLKIGDDVVISGSTGTVTATVVAVADTKGILGTIYVTPETMAATGALTDVVSTDPSQVLASPHALFVTLDDDVSPNDVRKEMERVLASSYIFSVLDSSELSEVAGSQATQILAVLYALLGLSLVIAALGIINTLVLSVSERSREIGLVRAVGLGRAQIIGEITLESVVTAVFGTIVGTLTGIVLAGALRAQLKDQGMTKLVVPWGQLTVTLLLSIIIGVLAALWPALKAARMPVMRAISTE